jgi:hypothetical protein
MLGAMGRPARSTLRLASKRSSKGGSPARGRRGLENRGRPRGRGVRLACPPPSPRRKFRIKTIFTWVVTWRGARPVSKTVRTLRVWCSTRLPPAPSAEPSSPARRSYLERFIDDVFLRRSSGRGIGAVPSPSAKRCVPSGYGVRLAPLPLDSGPARRWRRPTLSPRMGRAAARARRPPPCAGGGEDGGGGGGEGGGGLKAKDRRPKTEDRRPKTEDRRPKTEDRSLQSEACRARTKGPRARERASSSVVRASARRAEGRWFDSTLAHDCASA